ncbi:ribosome-assembly protein 3-domain-containing protein [Phycomyces nitens]|nr:ribosome-assembly protein 3-domain-containing protein [Phycomyces nitens]
MDEDADADEESVETKSLEDHKSTKQQFRDHYMTKMTQAFGTDLDAIRQEPSFDTMRLNILISSLEAGVDIFSDLEQDIILAESKEVQ